VVSRSLGEAVGVFESNLIRMRSRLARNRAKAARLLNTEQSELPVRRYGSTPAVPRDAGARGTDIAALRQLRRRRICRLVGEPPQSTPSC
jgi:hypothetical protein